MENTYSVDPLATNSLFEIDPLVNVPIQCSLDFTALEDIDLFKDINLFSNLERAHENAAELNTTAKQPKRGRPSKSDQKKKKNLKKNVTKELSSPIEGNCNRSSDSENNEEREEQEEALRTWNVGKMVLMQENDENGVMSALRRS